MTRPDSHALAFLFQEQVSHTSTSLLPMTERCWSGGSTAGYLLRCVRALYSALVASQASKHCSFNQVYGTINPYVTPSST